MKLIEKLLLALSFIGLVMMFLHLQGSTWLFMISLALVATIYFPLGFLFFSNVGMRQLFKGGLSQVNSAVIILAVVTGLGLSTLCIGILYRLLHFPGAYPMLYTGLFISMIVLVIHLVRQSRARTDAGKKSIIRLAVFSVLGVAMVLTSSRTLLSLQYRDSPEYVDAYMEYMNNPTEENLKKKDLEYYRMVLTAEEFERYNERMN